MIFDGNYLFFTLSLVVLYIQLNDEILITSQWVKNGFMAQRLIIKL